ncbi:hypothetical protein [Salinispira pacifica]|uniref:Periplasmic heavy metal sensor n=1 Tax=Salinispira pacifica TaxID=1307761 RepID=V5WDE1_9SPIO|nr:hypothetical protein [Salinispira pacifica]AHC13620.1 hypothetical protein L21SP2_0176 [Salinispira pacifica]
MKTAQRNITGKDGMQIGGNAVKRIAIILLILSSAAAVWAEDNSPEAELLGSLERLGITEDELSTITEIQQEYADSRNIPMAEIEILRARVSRELLADEPDLREVENLIRESLDYELEIRMAEIVRELGMQQVLGPRRWALIKQLNRQLRQSGMNFPALSRRIREARPDLRRAIRIMELYAE